MALRAPAFRAPDAAQGRWMSSGRASGSFVYTGQVPST